MKPPGGFPWAMTCLLGLVTLAGACGRSVDIAGLQTDLTVEVDGMERVYDLYVPTVQQGHSEELPLVVLLHANRSSRDDITGRSRATSPYAQWLDIADTEGVTLLIPQGLEGPAGHTGWNDCRNDGVGNPGADDVSFIVSAIDEVAAAQDVDRDRVFAMGTSNGGHMSIRLAEEVPERFAGIAVVAAGMPADNGCASTRQPMSVLFMAGTADPIAPFTGGAMASDRGSILSAADSVAVWLDRNGITNTPSAMTLPDLDTSDDSTVQRVDYPLGPGGASVRAYWINGGGHAEPSIEARYRRVFERVVGRQNHDIEMATEVWAFFSRLGQ